MLAKSNILLVGAGQLGFRYLQGLLKVKVPLNVVVIDPSESALIRCRSLLTTASPYQDLHFLSFFSSLDRAPRYVDLVIVSTTADHRSSVAEAISAYSDVRFWLFEKVLARSVSQLHDISMSTSGASGCWVNTPRRTMAWYNEIKKSIRSDSALSISRVGGDWGIACNSIHFIDLMCWLTGEDLLAIDCSRLASAWHVSKRPGFYEIFGQLDARFSGGSSLHLMAGREVHDSGVAIDDGRIRWRIDESKGRATSSAEEIIEGTLEFQSDLTSGLVEELLLSGNCKLPTLEESTKQHTILIDGLLCHWNNVGGTKDLELPIT